MVKPLNGNDYQYCYDANGNLTSRSISCPTTPTYTYNAANEVTNSGYSYDANGNLTAAPTSQTYGYNSKDQTTTINGTSITYAGGSQVERLTAGSESFLNDALGLARRTASSASTYYTRYPSGRTLGQRTSGAASGNYYYLKKRPSCHDFYAWVRRPDVAERLERRPLSDDPVRRIGGWLEVVAAARARAAEGGIDNPLLKSLPRVYDYTDREIIAALQEVKVSLAPRIGDRSPRVSEYRAERLRLQQESIDAGSPRALPSDGLVMKWRKGWDNALIAARQVASAGEHQLDQLR